METVITRIRGDSLDATTCIFCDKSDDCVIFGIEESKRYDGTVLRHFSICKYHLNKLNALLSGEFDIDRINLDNYRKVHIGRGIRLRG